MNDHLSANIRLLEKRQPALASLIRASFQPEIIEISPSRRSGPTASYRISPDRILYLHSRSDPLQEARQAIRKGDIDGADYYILLGFGLGYNLDALLEMPDSRENHYFILEADLKILAAAFSARDLSALLSLPYLHFAWPPAGPELGEQWNRFFDPVKAQKSVYISHGPSLSLQPEAYKSAVEVIQSQIFQIFTDINTLVSKSRTFLDNFVENLTAARQAPGIAAFRKAFSQKPAVLVSAGPSLDKNIHDLRGAGEGIVLIAADTTIKPLLNAGVEPHFVMTGDPTIANYRHLEGAHLEHALVIAEVTAHPGVFREFAGRIVSCIYENSSLRSLSRLLGNKGTLRAWGSVATMALDFALTLGCNPIIFVGQDLAHTDGRLYCSGVYFEKEWFAGVTTPEGRIRRCEELRAQRKTIMMTDIFGDPIETTDKLASYWNWISKEIAARPDIQFINATEGGILRDHVTLCSLRDALWRHSIPGLNPRSVIDSIWTSAQRDVPLPEKGTLEKLVQESETLSASLATGREICLARPSEADMDLIRKLEGIKESIYEARLLAPLIDSFNQMGNLTFLRSIAAWNKKSQVAADPNGLKKTYLEYFESVLSSLQVLSEALGKIRDIETAGRNTHC